MALSISDHWQIAAPILLIISWTILTHVRRRHKTDLDNLPGPDPRSFLSGHFTDIFSRNQWEFHQRLLDNFGGVVGLNGPLGERLLYVSDPRALQHIFLKDQDAYEQAENTRLVIKTLLGEGLASMTGEPHRKQRKMLNPVFSISNIRNLVSIYHNVSHKLVHGLENQISRAGQEVDVHQWMTRTSLELTCQGVLGYSVDELVDETNNHPISSAVITFSPYMMIAAQFAIPTLNKVLPPKFRRYLVDLASAPFRSIRMIRDASDVLHSTAVEIFESRKRALAADVSMAKQVGRGKDIMTIIVKANMEAAEEDKLPDSEVFGQVAIFIFASMDTTSGMRSRVLHLVASHSEVQDRLREEIEQAYSGKDELTYDELDALPFLDAVCRETLRLYPPLAFIGRITTRDVVLPFSQTVVGKDGSKLNAITVPAGTRLIISILNVNRDPSIWGSDSSEWKPERWLSPLPISVKEARMPGVYSNVMTFVGGSRACIGFKVGVIETKAVLATLLRRFKFSLTDKDIGWGMLTVTSPFVDSDPGRPQLPLIVTPL